MPSSSSSSAPPPLLTSAALSLSAVSLAPPSVSAVSVSGSTATGSSSTATATTVTIPASPISPPLPPGASSTSSVSVAPGVGGVGGAAAGPMGLPPLPGTALPPPAATIRSASSTSASASASRLHHASLPSASAQRDIAEARQAVDASIANLLDNQLQDRAALMHDNMRAIAAQQRDLARATVGLRRTNDGLARFVHETTREIKEMGHVQNWAEVQYRNISVLEETLRLVRERNERRERRGRREQQEAAGGEDLEGHDGSGSASYSSSYSGSYTGSSSNQSRSRSRSQPRSVVGGGDTEENAASTSTQVDDSAVSRVEALVQAFMQGAARGPLTAVDMGKGKGKGKAVDAGLEERAGEVLQQKADVPRPASTVGAPIEAGEVAEAKESVKPVPNHNDKGKQKEVDVGVQAAPTSSSIQEPSEHVPTDVVEQPSEEKFPGEVSTLPIRDASVREEVNHSEPVAFKIPKEAAADLKETEDATEQKADAEIRHALVGDAESAEHPNDPTSKVLLETTAELEKENIVKEIGHEEESKAEPEPVPEAETNTEPQQTESTDKVPEVDKEGLKKEKKVAEGKQAVSSIEPNTEAMGPVTETETGDRKEQQTAKTTEPTTELTA